MADTKRAMLVKKTHMPGKKQAMVGTKMAMAVKKHLTLRKKHETAHKALITPPSMAVYWRNFVSFYTVAKQKH